MLIDTLDFFLRKHRHSLTASHLLAQAVDHGKRRSYYLKGDARQYEVHTWDDDWIYLALDRDPSRAYVLQPGAWLGRRLAAGDEVVADGEARIIWYDGVCRPQRLRPYHYTVKLEQHLPTFDAGGDLGRQEVIVARYLPDKGLAERFYYSREWGWIGWEEYDDNGTLKHRELFNRIVRRSLKPAVGPACESVIWQT